MSTARNGHYNFSTAHFPLRVIHVGDTLANKQGGVCFIKPTNWNFHVLSHTWSQDIRDMSTQIGKLLMQRRSGSTTTTTNSSDHVGDVCSAYNQAFLRPDLSGGGLLAYKDLVELLRLLKEERVESIWFDALCIDQTNDDEKNTEICRMAAYYANSQGCYVLMHGVGQGYHLWRQGSPKQIPRWFERVWTFQEFILSQNLTFIVEGLDHRVVSIVNRLMDSGSPSDPSIGLCACCLPSDLLEKRPSSISDLCRGSAGFTCPPYSIRECRNSRDICCSKCGGKVLLRTTSKPGQPVKPLHFVDREAFLLVARTALLLDTPGRWIKNWGYEQMLCSMYQILLEGRANPRQILSRIGERYCSVPEDRVLSILGVLGVQEGAKQLRTKETLEDQIVKAANLCDQSTIIELCATDAVGYYVEGMSWSPNFRDNWNRHTKGWMDAERQSIITDSRWTSDIRWIRPNAEVLFPVTRKGMRMRCRVGEACMMMSKCVKAEGKKAEGKKTCSLKINDSFQWLLELSKWEHCRHSDDNPKHKTQVVSRVQQKDFKGIYMKDFLPVGYSNSIEVYLTLPSKLIPEDANEQEDEVVLGDFKVRLVLLGSVEEPVSGTRLELIMVCLGEYAAQGELELHKVGMLAMTSDEAISEIFTKERSECVVGGFGKDLSKYLNIIAPGAGSSSSCCTTAQEQPLSSELIRPQVATSSSAASWEAFAEMVHIPLNPIFEWTRTFLRISYPDGGEAVAYSGSDPVIFRYDGRPINLDLEAPHIKQLVHRYLMDRASLPEGCPANIGICGMSTIQFFPSKMEGRDIHWIPVDSDSEYWGFKAPLRFARGAPSSS